MDLDHADKQFALRLSDLLNASPFDFTHDIAGIINNMDRQAGLVQGGFVPRFAGLVE